MSRLLYKISTFFCAINLAICVVLSGCNALGPSADSLPIREIFLREKVISELVNVYVKGDLLRIESIDPGLDTCSLTVIMYSLAIHQELCRLPLGEDSWYTDWTEDGFYAVSMNTRSVFLYDITGILMEKRSFPTQIKQISFLMMDPTANTYFVGSGEEARLYLYDVDSGFHRDVGQLLFGYHNPIGYKDGYFYLEGETDLLRIKTDGDYAETAYCHNKNMVKFPEMGISIDEDSLQIIRPNIDGILSFPKMSDSQYPLAGDKTRFAIGDGDKSIRVYSLTSDTVHTLQFEQEVMSAAFYKDYLLVNTNGEDGHRLFLATCDGGVQQRITAYSTTTTVPITMPTENTNPTQTTTTPSLTPTVSNAHKIVGVPVIAQMPDYPTGCESVSTVMVLNYWGEPIDTDTFINQFLPKSAYFYSKNDVYYGPNPYEFFIGDPRSPHSYGCMPPVIEKALVKYFGSNHRVVNTTGMTLQNLCAKYVEKDIPVLLWATIGMLETYSGANWQFEDGTVFEWPANEHCMVLIGYDEDHYIFNDPYSGQIKTFDKWLVEKRYKEMGSQSLVITG